ncbi:RNA recognition motif domain-containing protein [Psychromonas hadalis]|uniref:RNA recognition motif domain-containing protein n=1 Tax=Psychromonas hadalis TaxID=211669 RepID=UPI0003B4FE1E|nr:RNA-binding protein [Psychromonas hadalis]
MKSNTSILLSIAVAILGYIIIAVAGLTLSAEISFAIGAIATGIAIQFIKTGKSTSATSSSSSDDDFATTTLYVGNLPYRANEMAIRTLFAEQGKVLSVRLMKDKHTGKRRGFGFVEMPEKDAQKAISVLNEQEFQDRSLKVREANERAPRTEPQQNDET